MPKIGLGTVSSFQNDSSAVATVNANSATLQTAFDNTLSRDGTSPNQMKAALDMNSFRILNPGMIDMGGQVLTGLPAAVNPDDAVRLADLSNFVVNGGGGGGGTGNVNGPATNLDGTVAIWNGINSKTIKDSAVNIGSSPEAFGATGGADDTAAFIALGNAIAAGTVHHVTCFPGRTYNVWPTTPSNPSTLINCNQVDGLFWDMNGANFNIGYTGTAVTNLFVFAGAKNVTMVGLKGTSALGYQDSNSTKGTTWVDCQQGGGAFGNQNMRFLNCNINGGIAGIVFTRSPGAGTFSNNIEVTGKFQNVGYPLNLQMDGCGTRFNIDSIDHSRAVFLYNVRDVKGTLRATRTAASSGHFDGILEDLNISIQGNALENVSGLSNSTTSDIDITYIDQDSTVYSSGPVMIEHIPNGVSTTANNITIRYDVKLNGTPSTNVFTTVVVNPTPGGIVNNGIVLTGRILGDTGANNLMCLMSANAFTGVTNYGATDIGRYAIRDMYIPNCTKPLACGANDTWINLQNVYMPNATTPAFDGGANTNRRSYRQVLFSGTAGGDPVSSGLNIWDQSAANVALRARAGNAIMFDNPSSSAIAVIGGGSGSFDLSSTVATDIRFSYNNTLAWRITTGGLLTPQTDNNINIGDATHRVGSLFATNHILTGNTSGQLTLKAAAVAGTNTLTLPAGSTDFSATGGSGQVVKQTSAGGAFTVATVAASEISSGATLTAANDTNVTLTMSGSTTSVLAATTITAGWTGTLAVSRGGTGAGTFTSNAILKGNGTGAITADGTWTLPVTAGVSSLTGTMTATNAISLTNLSGTYTDVTQPVWQNWSVSFNNSGVTGPTPMTGFKVQAFTSVSNTAANSNVHMNDYQANFTATGGASLNTMNAFRARAGIFGTSPTGTITNINYFDMDQFQYSQTGSPSLTITNLCGMFVDNVAASTPPAGVTITNQYGIKIAAQNFGATNRYALFYDSDNTGNHPVVIQASGGVNIGVNSDPGVNNLQVAGFIGSKAPVTVTGSTYTVGANDVSIILNNAGGGVTITFPSASGGNVGRWIYVITKQNFGANSASSNIQPATTTTLTNVLLSATAGKFAALQSDGTNWVVMMAN